MFILQNNQYVTMRPLLVTETLPANSTSVGGMYYDIFGNLIVRPVDDVPSDAVSVGGFAASKLGGIFVTTQAPQTYINGLGYRLDGALCVKYATPPAVWSNGVPMTSDGYVIGDLGFSASLTTTVVPEVAGSGTPTFSRSTPQQVRDCNGDYNLAGSGEVAFRGAKRVQQLFVTTENLSSASWNKSNSSVTNVTSSVASTDRARGANVWKIIPTTTAGFVGETVTPEAGARYIISCMARAAEHTEIEMVYPAGWFSDATARRSRFTLIGAGSEATIAGTGQTNTITSLGGGWYLCEMLATVEVSAAASPQPFRCATTSTVGGSNGFYGCGPMLEKASASQTRASIYVTQGSASAPEYQGAMVDGVEYFNTDDNDAAISESTLWGYLSCRQITNEIRNNSMQGATAGVVGSGGAYPTEWVVTGGTGLTITIGTPGKANGIDYIDVTLAGTTADTAFTMSFESNTQVVAAQNDVYSLSAFIALIAGSYTNISATNMNVIGNDAGGTLLTTDNTAFTAAGGELSGNRVSSRAVTLTDASTAYVNGRLRILFSSGVAINITLRIGWPQLEKNDKPTSPIRTTTAAVTRNADSLTYASAGNASETAGTMRCTATSEFVRTGAGEPHVGLCLARGTATANDITLCHQGAANASSAAIINATSQQMNSTQAGAAAATPRDMALAWETDNCARSFDGVLGTDANATMPTALTTIYIGRDDASGSQLDGCVKDVKFYTRRLSNAQVTVIAP